MVKLVLLMDLFFSVFFDAPFARYIVQGREVTKGMCLIVSPHYLSVVSQSIN